MTKFFNQTRESKSIPLKLIKNGKFYLLPIYFLASLSDLGQEGINNSGSYKFADHIYKGVPSGKYILGNFIDRIFLNFQSAKSFQKRHTLSKKEILDHLKLFKNEKAIHILSIPSGIPRNLIEVADSLSQKDSKMYKKTFFHCLDLDQKVHKITQNTFEKEKLNQFIFYNGDAFNKLDYKIKPHIIVSTGLGEFLDDNLLLEFYTICYSVLVKNGVFITSATNKHWLSDYLLRNIAELNTNYRSKKKMKKILRNSPFEKNILYKDDIGFQTIVVARKTELKYNSKKL